MTEAEARKLKVGDRVVFRNNGPDDGDTGTVTTKEKTKFVVVWDDDLDIDYRYDLARSVHRV